MNIENGSIKRLVILLVIPYQIGLDPLVLYQAVAQRQVLKRVVAAQKWVVGKKFINIFFFFIFTYEKIYIWLISFRDQTLHLVTYHQTTHIHSSVKSSRSNISNSKIENSKIVFTCLLTTTTNRPQPEKRNRNNTDFLILTF